MSNLKAKYTFVSPTTGNTYVLHVQTGPLTNPIRTIDNPNCIGWTIVSGTFVAVVDGVSTSYNVPGGNTLMIYNGLWQSAAASPDGSVLCQGIDRLFVFVSSDNGNTSISANSNNSIQISLGTLNDSATLSNFVFPPQ